MSKEIITVESVGKLIEKLQKFPKNYMIVVLDKTDDYFGDEYSTKIELKKVEFSESLFEIKEKKDTGFKKFNAIWLKGI